MAAQASPSAANSGEVAWRKSSHSGGGKSCCVEVADLSATKYSKIGVRDSKRPAGPALVRAASAYDTFVLLAIAQAM
ncbi:DUF397 domain-containing protein [Streptomyces sp. NPDC060031]|uniref:DUF397 domain-containing protein n=1 Tax=Streptomyces sp. NPDC060031 TaxID=3347043 RepID=UPI0036A7D4BD